MVCIGGCRDCSGLRGYTRVYSDCKKIRIIYYMSYSQNSLKGDYIGDYIGNYYRGY